MKNSKYLLSAVLTAAMAFQPAAVLPVNVSVTAAAETSQKTDAQDQGNEFFHGNPSFLFFWSVQIPCGILNSERIRGLRDAEIFPVPRSGQAVRSN